MPPFFAKKEEPKQEGPSAEEAQMTTFLKTQEALATALQGLTAMQEKQGEMLQNLHTAVTGQAPPAPAPPEEKELSDDEINNLSNADMLRLTLKEVKKVLTPTVDELETVKSTQTRNTQRDEWLRYAERNPDFAMYKDELGAILQRNPSITAEEAHALARHYAPDDKVAQADAVLRKARGEPEPQTQEEEDKKPGIVAMLPRPPRREAGEESGSMSQEDAAEDAWSRSGLADVVGA